VTEAAVTPALSAMPKRARTHTRTRRRRRDYIPGLAAAACLLLSYFLYGAAQPVAALTLSACLIVAAVLSVVIAGPKRVTIGMLAVALLIWAFTATGLAGRLDRAAPDLSVLFAAGGIWTIAHISARQRGALDVAWAAVIWTAAAFCVWTFFSHIAANLEAPGAPTVPAFGSFAAADLLFGLFALTGSSRVLHVIKQVDAEALARSAMIDRLLRDALGGLLLTGFALTCLVLTGSLTGLLLTAAALLGHAWWDTRAIFNRDHRSTWARWVGRISPYVAIILAVASIGLSWLHDDSIPANAAAAAIGDAPRLARLVAYMQAWLDHPWLGEGLGSIDIAAARETTLTNAIVMSAPGGPQNVLLQWLVETGVAGTAAILLVVIAMHVRIVAGFRGHKAPRTFLRLAIVASGFMLIHGATDSALDLPSAVWLYAFILGAACAIATGRRTKVQQQPI
jgi:O-antigen ligase